MNMINIYVYKRCVYNDIMHIIYMCYIYKRYTLHTLQTYNLYISINDVLDKQKIVLKTHLLSKIFRFLYKSFCKESEIFYSINVYEKTNCQDRTCFKVVSV